VLWIWRILVKRHAKRDRGRSSKQSSGECTVTRYQSRHSDLLNQKDVYPNKSRCIASTWCWNSKRSKAVQGGSVAMQTTLHLPFSIRQEQATELLSQSLNFFTFGYNERPQTITHCASFTSSLTCSSLHPGHVLPDQARAVPCPSQTHPWYQSPLRIRLAHPPSTTHPRGRVLHI
jgi:hypothetical protein